MPKKSLFKKTLLLALLLLSAAVIPGLGCDPAQAAQPVALIYRGPVVGCSDCSEPVAALLDTDTKYDFQVIYVGPDEDYSVQEGLALPNAVLYVQPGGDGDLDDAYGRVSSNASAIRSFVNKGGRYLGICMGGYLADDDPGYGFSIDTDQYITSWGATVRTEDPAMVKVNWRGTDHWMYFQDGPYFIPKSGVSGQTILARYSNNKVAAMVQPYGQGKVGVSGPHPEANTSWLNEDDLYDRDGTDASLGRDLIDTLMEGVVIAEKSSAKQITSFTINGVSSTINQTSRTITVNLPAGTSVTSLTPTIAVSAKATVSPTSGTAKSFASPVTYTVTAEDGTKHTYTVTVTVAKSSEKNITAFTINGVSGTISQTNHTIALSLPTGTSLASLTPTITVSAKATVSPASGTAKSFSSPVVYTVTAEDGTKQTYTVTVTVAAAKSSEKQITAFTLKGVNGAIDQTAHTVSVTLPVGSSLGYMAPVITVSSKASVSPESGAYRNFNVPLTYAVTAEDGTKQTYTVTVTVATTKSSEKKITSFNLAGKAGTINQTDHSISVTLPAGTSITSLAPSMEISAKASVSPASGVYKDFTNPVSYIVTAEDGTKQTYTVTVSLAAVPSAQKQITSFTLKGVAGTINQTDHTVSVILPAGTSVTSLTPTIAVSAKATVSPTSGTAKSFSLPVIYTVTAEDGTKQTYTVTVTLDDEDETPASSAKDITNFILEGVTGNINTSTYVITVNFPAGTDVTALTPDVYLSAKASISPASGIDRDFTNPVTYKVTAEDGSVRNYTVKAVVAAQNDGSPTATIKYDITATTNKNVIATLVPSEEVTVTSSGGTIHTFTQNGTFTFEFKDSDGHTGSAVAKVANIDKENPVITLKGNSVMNLTTDSSYTEPGATATDNVSGTLSVNITGSVDMDTPGTYTLTYAATDEAGNKATETRTVKVSDSDIEDDGNDIISFKFKAFDPDVIGVIDQASHKITLTVPYGTNLAYLVPTIVISDGATISPESGESRDFSFSRTYTVTSEGGDVQTYNVIVKVGEAPYDYSLGINDGDIIQCKSSDTPYAVYIVKIVGQKRYIRHIVSLEIFNYYKHLKWENLKQVSSLDGFSLSGWVRVNTGANGTPGAHDKVWEINADQTKHWINMTAQQFLSHGGSDEAIYRVNQGELDLYRTGPDVMSL